MSTLPGLASKGERGKSKFQSLDINNLYRVSLGESVEKQQQKNTSSLKHGMQSLGKVPSARRPPANLPSLKSEHSGSDSAVSLVPSNGSGWGKQESTSSTTTTTNTISPSTVTNTSVTQLSAHQAAIALPVTTTIPPPNNKPHTVAVIPATGDKSWSSVMTGNETGGHPPPYQSPQFQHEFPSLSAGDGVPVRSGTDTQYGPGPSLRPQTEGSWILGGAARGPPEAVPATAKINSGPLGAPPQLAAPGGQPLPAQYRVFMPPFMYRGNGNAFPPSNGHGAPPNVTTTTQPANANSAPNPARGKNEQRGGGNVGQKQSEVDELAHRPIIKEEELSGMDNLTGDMGWAMHDDIDYNQKLAFSDEESKTESREARRQQHRLQMQRDDSHHQSDQNDHHHNKSWSNNQQSLSSNQNNHHHHQQQQQQQQQQASRNRQEDEEISMQRRRHQLEIASAVERAKKRKEEEEKKYLESKQNAAKKLQKLDEKSNKSKRDKENDESIGTINPASIPPQTIAPVPILLPEWEREREREREPRPVQNKNKPEDKPMGKNAAQSDFRQMTQIEGRSTFQRKESRSTEKEQNTPNFSRQFQNDLPPRFQKQQQFNASSVSSNPHQYDNRWSAQGPGNKTSPNNRKNRDGDEKERDRDEDRYRRNDDGYRNTHRSSYSDSGRKSSNDNRHESKSVIEEQHDFIKKEKDEENKREKNRDRHESKSSESFDNSSTISRQNSDEWHGERRMDRFDRPQRPDSRDSRASRESRQSEPREYFGSWPESHYEENYEEEKKKEHRMQVPGPITKEKIEADDLRNEKRNLTQLKRGTVLDKKLEKEKEKTPERENEDMWSIRKKEEKSRSWADDISPNIIAPENPKFEAEVVTKQAEVKIEEEKKEKIEDKDDKRGGSSRGRTDSQSSRNSGGWNNTGGPGLYRSSWSKKGGSERGRGPPPRGGTRKSNEWLGSESDASMDDANVNVIDNQMQRSPKAGKKIEECEKEKKDLKTTENKNPVMEKKIEKSHHRDYIPRGEPSRHGRGGSNSFRGGGRGGGVKRIDGYGPPPVKSPFSHPEEKEKVVAKSESDSAEVNQDDKNKPKQEVKRVDDRAKERKPENRRVKRPDEDTSDHSDDSKDKMRKGPKQPVTRPNPQTNPPPRRNPPSMAPPARNLPDKRSFGGPTRNEPPNRQNSSGSLRTTTHPKDKEKENIQVDVKKDDIETNEHEPEFAQSDSEGFQEVKSKKTVKTDRPPRIEEKQKIPPAKNPEKESITKPDRNKPKPALSQQQIANIPSLMATPVNPPANIPQPQPNKTQFERPRQNKLPPRLVKQRENKRLHQAQMQGMCGEMNDINKVNQQNVYSMKEGGVVGNTMTNAWEKPLGAQLRGNNMEQDNGVLSVGLDSCKNMEQSQVHCQNSTNVEDKTVLDGTKPLNTIIFENTNFKQTPGCRTRNEKPRPNKIEENIEGGNNVLANFNKPIGELLNKNDKNEISMPLNFNKEDNADMKLDFFESEISHLTEDKTSKSIGLPRTMHGITSSNSTISPSTADALNIKIQSVKKVWETMPTVMEHANVQDDGSSFPTFGPDPNGLDGAAFIKGAETAQDDNHEVYSPSPNNQNSTNGTTNVCKVKPTQQVAGSAGQTVMSTGGGATHQPHSAMVGPGPGLMGHPLSPPPMQPIIGGGGVGLGQPPQQFTANQHLGYQAGLGGSTQYGMPAIPSPPTVLYNSTAQQLQAQTGLYGAFQIDQTQVMNTQGRSQYSQYSYGLSQAASSPYSQSMYLQTAQPHAPPTAQPPPDLYTNMSNYRIPATGPFGQNQQLNNPTTVLISSTSNSLMSATVKPSNQQISAIGTKAGGVGQAYQQQSQQGQQLYMAYDPTLQANYLQNTGVMQRPGGPVQNNVVQTLQPSASSYYSGSTGGQTGYFQQPANSNLPSAQMPQHQASYGLQGSVFGTHSQSHTNAGMQNYGSHFLSGPIQLAAAAINAQQYRSATQLPNAYMKSVGNQQMADQSGRSQQLKSPGGQQEVLSSVFNTGSQIPSPKSRQTCKQQPPPQPSPTAQHKYLYSSVSNQQPGQTRYPTPIQRPVNYQQLGNSVQNSNPKHRNQNNSGNRTAPRQYYGGQGGNMNTQNDKNEEAKLADNSGNNPNSSNSGTTNSNTNIVTKGSVPSVVQPTDKAEASKEDKSAAISKD